jgi:hypothetical protein
MIAGGQCPAIRIKIERAKLPEVIDTTTTPPQVPVGKRRVFMEW